MKLRIGLRRTPGAETRDPNTAPGHGEFEGVAAFYDYLMGSVPYRSWVDYIEAILQKRLARPRRVLDLCCGTGRVGAEMLRRGYEAVGVDLSEPMVRRCADQLPALAAAVQDACLLGLRPRCMDLVVCLFDSLNYITEPARLAQCFAQVHTVLAEGGLFIFDLNTPRALSTGLFNQDNLRSSDRLLYSWRAHWDPGTRLCRVDMWFRWQGDGESSEVTETHWQYAHDHKEVLAMLSGAGFSAVTAYDAFSFRPPHRKSDRLYYVARKE